MINISSFTFGPFQENTYVLHDETKQCVIIDPGCYHPEEREELISFMENEGLKPVKLLNTHCHIDHVFGNKFIAEKYKLGLEINKHDLPVLQALGAVGRQYGLATEDSPMPSVYLNEGDKIKFGNSEMEIFFTPGHSPGSICFYNKQQKFVIGGDVLFYGSIGRTDLPGGDFDTLINSIKQKLFKLEDDFKVYSGHGPVTTIGFERENNPFL